MTTPELNSHWWHKYGYGKAGELMAGQARRVRILALGSDSTKLVVRFPSGAIEVVLKSDLVGPCTVEHTDSVIFEQTPTGLSLKPTSFFSRLFSRLNRRNVKATQNQKK